MKNAILFIIDGMTSEALKKAHTPNLHMVMKEGSYTYAAKTVSPSITLPAHMSIFSSLTPKNHGVLTNTGLPDMWSMGQNFFSQVKLSGGNCASFYSWENLRNLSLPGILDHSFYCKIREKEDLEKLGFSAFRYIVKNKPRFSFVYLEWPDINGHEYGWESDEYYQAVEYTDKIFGLILENLRSEPELNDQNIIVHSDHGGKGFHHNDPFDEVISIPWIASGPYIKKDFRIEDSISIIDTAPTLARMLDIPLHYAWEGKVAESIFIKEKCIEKAVLKVSGS